MLNNHGLYSRVHTDERYVVFVGDYVVDFRGQCSG